MAVDTLKQIAELFKQFQQATTRRQKIMLLLQIAMLAAKAGLDLAPLFAEGAVYAAANPPAACWVQALAEGKAVDGASAEQIVRDAVAEALYEVTKE